MRDVNPTLRGFAILVVLAAAITAFQLRVGLEIVLLFLQILFLLAIAYVLFMLWRTRREEISMWSARSRAVFYGGAALAIANIGLAFTSWYPVGGLESLVFLLVLAAAVFAMWRVWRDEHTYGY
ncbi:MAG TPA: hypothetical protein VHF23_04620 [Gaiellaceae bacterium]|nr:hypothetical protein [Gaiellaceae bacterium]